MLGCGAAAAVLRRMRTLPARGALCLLLCGALFCFANPPLQTPDETDHYLRTYAISMGRLDFDYDHTYPDDVAALVQAFPGGWVNAHTSVGLGTDPDTGEEKPYDTAGYALKQYGSDGAIQSVADSFAEYFATRDDPAEEPVHEPVSFLVLPFLPGALGMAVARLFGLGALGCLYGGRLGNLVAYTAICWLALRQAQKYRPALLGVMLLPLSLFMGGSLSYDATLLACYYLMIALLLRDDWTTRTAGIYLAACTFVSVAKPYLNLLWVVLVLLVPLRAWHAKGRRWQWSLGYLAGALAATMATEAYGRVMRCNYPVIARQGGEAVGGMEQLIFVLSNPLRSMATFWGTLCENEFFIGQLGLFGWKDLPIPLLNLLGPVALGLAVLLASAQPAGLGRRRPWARRSGGVCVGAMAAMYITYTPVAMVRIVGLQARYFLPVFLALALVAVAPLRRLLAPQLPLPRAERLAVPLFAGHALLGAVLLFQHYFCGASLLYHPCLKGPARRFPEKGTAMPILPTLIGLLVLVFFGAVCLALAACTRYEAALLPLPLLVFLVLCPHTPFSLPAQCDEFLFYFCRFGGKRQVFIAVISGRSDTRLCVLPPGPDPTPAVRRRETFRIRRLRPCGNL